MRQNPFFAAKELVQKQLSYALLISQIPDFESCLALTGGFAVQNEHHTVTQLIPVASYIEAMRKQKELASGVKRVRFFLATDDASAEAEIKAAFKSGEPALARIALLLHSRHSPSHRQLELQLSSLARGNACRVMAESASVHNPVKGWIWGACLGI